MKDYREIFECIDSNYQEYFSVWEDVCNIESPTNFKEGVDAVGRYFAELAIKRGWQVETFNQEVSGNVICITMNPEIKAKPITLSGHIDTVHAVGSFGSPAVKYDQEKIYGPGVLDCKGGIVAAFCAMDVLNKFGYSSHPIRLLLQTDEENGSKLSGKATINYICDKASDSLAFLNLEGHTRGEACLQRKGIITFLFTITGVAGHAARCASEGANAVVEAAHKIVEIDKIKDNDGITCCCSVVRGGETVNTIPDKCEFKVNVRYATVEQHSWICDFMQNIADKVYVEGTKTTVSTLSTRMAMELCEKNIQLLEKVNKCFEVCDLPTLTVAKRVGGSDAAEVTTYGIPCIDSLGATGGNIHTLKEFAYINSLGESAKRIVAVALNITE